MKIIILLFVFATALVAQNPKPEHKGPQTGGPDHIPPHLRPKLTEQQKKVRAELIVKYDTNKDGKLDGKEKKAVSREDRKKLGPPGRPPKRD